MAMREVKDCPNLCSVQTVFIIFLNLLCIFHRNRLCHHQILTTGQLGTWMATVWNGVHA